MKTLVIRTRDAPRSESGVNGISLNNLVDHLSLVTPEDAFPAAQQLHKQLHTAFEAAAEANPSLSLVDSCREFQQITGLRRAEADWYIQQAQGSLKVEKAGIARTTTREPLMLQADEFFNFVPMLLYSFALCCYCMAEGIQGGMRIAGVLLNSELQMISG
jgi:hypothetical protein